MTDIDPTDTDPTAFIRRAMPLCDTLGMTASTLSPACVELHMSWADGLCTSNRLLHGGALMALIDSAAATAAFLNLPDHATGTSTIESKTNFLGAVSDGTVSATAVPLHVGSTTIVVETEVRHDGRLVAKATQTQIVLRRS